MVCVCLNLPLPSKNRNILILNYKSSKKVEHKIKETKPKNASALSSSSKSSRTHTQLERRRKKTYYFYMRKFQQNYIKTSSKIRNSLFASRLFLPFSLSLFLQTYTHTHTNTQTRAWLSFVTFLGLFRVSLRGFNQITTTHTFLFVSFSRCKFLFLSFFLKPPILDTREVESYRAIQEHTIETEEE